MQRELIEILESNTPLREDTDLFYLEIPLSKSGLWFADRQNESKRTGYKDFDVYYRGKDKASSIANITYFKDAIDGLDVCSLEDGTIFKLIIQYEWEYLEKDAEGYYVFTTVMRLI